MSDASIPTEIEIVKRESVFAPDPEYITVKVIRAVRLKGGEWECLVLNPESGECEYIVV